MVTSSEVSSITAQAVLMPASGCRGPARPVDSAVEETGSEASAPGRGIAGVILRGHGGQRLLSPWIVRVGDMEIRATPRLVHGIPAELRSLERVSLEPLPDLGG